MGTFFQDEKTPSASSSDRLSDIKYGKRISGNLINVKMKLCSIINKIGTGENAMNTKTDRLIT